MSYQCLHLHQRQVASVCRWLALGNPAGFCHFPTGRFNLGSLRLGFGFGLCLFSSFRDSCLFECCAGLRALALLPAADGSPTGRVFLGDGADRG